MRLPFEASAIVPWHTLFAVYVALLAQLNDPGRQLAHDIFKELIEINTTDSVGNLTTAAEAMAKRLRDSGYPESDVQSARAGRPQEEYGGAVAR